VHHRRQPEPLPRVDHFTRVSAAAAAGDWIGLKAKGDEPQITRIYADYLSKFNNPLADQQYQVNLLCVVY